MAILDHCIIVGVKGQNFGRGSGSLQFSVFRLLTDFVCLYTYEFWLSLCKIARSCYYPYLVIFGLNLVSFHPKILKKIFNDFHLLNQSEAMQAILDVWLRGLDTILTSKFGVSSTYANILKYHIQGMPTNILLQVFI